MTVDPELVEVGRRAVAAGLAASLSGWVSDALAAKVDRDLRLAALAGAIADYESQFGQISPEEIAAQHRADREAAVVVRGGQRASSKSTGKRRSRGAA